MKDLNQKTVYELDNKQEKQFLALKERHTRWQDKRINLLTFSINLFFTIAVASIGLIINNYDKDIFKDKFILCYSLPKVILLFLTISALAGMIALLCRLRDFRLTTKTVNTRISIFKVDNNIHQEGRKELSLRDLESRLACLKCSTRFLGKATWCLFFLQSILVLIGAVIMVIRI